MDFKSSETRANLMRAFAGESQARNRYTFAAEAAKKNKLYVLEYVFKFTADQEKAHAKVFFNHLQQLSGSEIVIDGSYPVEEYSDIKQVIENAEKNEYHEYDTVYKSFGDTAAKEGFLQAAFSFKEIANIELIHSKRFEYYKKLIENNELFVSKTQTGWMCLNCGYKFEGQKAPMMCPVCSHEQGYFIRLELVPYGAGF